MRTISVVLVLALVACADPTGAPPPPPMTPVMARAVPGATHLVWAATPGRAAAAIAQLGRAPLAVYTHALHGAAVVLTASDSAALVAAGVRVQTNGIVTAERAAPSWGLDRIDQRALPLGGSYLPPNEGAGVTAYILDSGIDIAHPEFGGRAVNGFDAIDGTFSVCHYHGTHVAGTVGGATVGVANEVALVNVRVLDCAGSGTFAQVIAGVEWVMTNAARPAVANMSLGGSNGGAVVTCETEALAAAVCNAIASGITFTLSAGNSAGDACVYTPGGAAPALTVSSSTSADGMSSFSNGGPCADLFAPGSDIWSAAPGGGYQSLSGTSMAAPHVAGHAAQVLSANPSWSPSQVGADLLARATPNAIGGIFVAGTPNLLLYTASGAAEPPPVECPPGSVPRGNSGKCRVLRH